jgi:hypothetical protein
MSVPEDGEMPPKYRRILKYSIISLMRIAVAEAAEAAHVGAIAAARGLC